MFRWNLMLQTLFGSRREQSKTRRAKETTKLRLEVLEDRTLPSASTLPSEYVASPPPVPPVAAISSYVNSTINQWSQFVVAVQQDLLGYYQGLIQEIAQIESAIVQEVDHFLGINPNASNPSFNTIVSQPGNGVGRGNNSGSGSGASAPTTHAAPTQPINHSPQQSGSGSGSGSNSTTTNRGNSPDNTLHPMTGSGATGSGSGSGSVGSGTGSGDATVYGNVWLDNDGDGSWDDGEMGYAGATVQLVNATTHQVVQTATTEGINGQYVFDTPPLLLGPQPVSFFVHVVLINQLGATFFKENGSQINTTGSSAPFQLRAGGWRQIVAGLLSMNVTTVKDDPGGPAAANLQDQVTLRDAIKTGNKGGGPLDLNTVTFMNYQVEPAQPLNGTITLLQKALDPITRSYNILGPGSTTLTVDGGKNGTIFAVNAGVISTIRGLTITGGSGANGGGIFNQGNLTLNDITLENNQTAGNGGGIANNTHAKLLLQDVTVENNTAIQNGGGLYNSGTATMSSAGFTLNKASMGGGIYNYGNFIAKDSFIDNEINDNAATGKGGGGVYNQGGKFQMDGGTISTNHATAVGPGVGNGGGIYQRLQKMTLSNVAIQSNNSAFGRQGGGIYVSNGTLTLNSDTIGGPAPKLGNTAGVGGGLYESLGTVNMVKGAFSYNNATITGVVAGVNSNGGGGIFIGGGKLTLTNVPIKDNASGFNGGGIDIAGSATPSVKMTGGSIANNIALNSGAGIFTMNGSLTLTANNGPNKTPITVSGNIATNQGGGLYLGTGSTTTFNGVFVGGNKAKNAANGNGVYWQFVNGVGAIVNPNPPNAPALTDPNDGGKPIKGP